MDNSRRPKSLDVSGLSCIHLPVVGVFCVAYVESVVPCVEALELGPEAPDLLWSIYRLFLTPSANSALKRHSRQAMTLRLSQQPPHSAHDHRIHQQCHDERACPDSANDARLGCGAGQ